MGLLARHPRLPRRDTTRARRWSRVQCPKWIATSTPLFRASSKTASAAAICEALTADMAPAGEC